MWVTENGVAEPNEANESLPGVLNDTYRIDFYRDYMQDAMAAVTQDNVRVIVQSDLRNPGATHALMRQLDDKGLVLSIAWCRLTSRATSAGRCWTTGAPRAWPSFLTVLCALLLCADQVSLQGVDKWLQGALWPGVCRLRQQPGPPPQAFAGLAVALVRLDVGAGAGLHTEHLSAMFWLGMLCFSAFIGSCCAGCGIKSGSCVALPRCRLRAHLAFCWSTLHAPVNFARSTAKPSDATFAVRT